MYLAVDRRGRRGPDGEQTADFINIVAFDRAGEFAERYFRQGMRVLVTGRIQTGSYVNKDGQKVYTTEVVVENQEFAESRNADSSASFSGSFGQGAEAPAARPAERPAAAMDGFMNIPEGIDEELPFT